MASQLNEDVILAELLPGKLGCYVDIGAHHPTHFSNTSQFYDRGWSGLLVESTPELAAELHRARPRDATVCVAASDHHGQAWLRMGSESTLNSIDPSWLNGAGQQVLVPTIPLWTLLESFPEIRDNCDLCSIDVEGHEAAVIRGTNFATFQPKVIVIESCTYGRPDDEPWREWEPFVLAAGYKIHESNSINNIYVRQ